MHPAMGMKFATLHSDPSGSRREGGFGAKTGRTRDKVRPCVEEHCRLGEARRQVAQSVGTAVRRWCVQSGESAESMRSLRTSWTAVNKD